MSRRGWEPRTRLGKLVAEEEITSMDEALNSGLPLKEPEITDQLLSLEDDVLDINMVQRMTDSGRRVKFRCVVAIGDRNGYVGYAEGRDDQVGSAIQKAIEIAKLNVVRVSRGCGSWECGCGRPHTVALRTDGKAGSVEVELRPAPRGLGLAAGATARSVSAAMARSSGPRPRTRHQSQQTSSVVTRTAPAVSGQTSRAASHVRVCMTTAMSRTCRT